MAIDTVERGIDSQPLIPTFSKELPIPEVKKNHVQMIPLNTESPEPRLKLPYPEDEYDTRNLVYSSILDAIENTKGKKDKRRVETYKLIRRGLQDFKIKDDRGYEEKDRWELTDDIKNYTDEIIELREKGDIELVRYDSKDNSSRPLVH